MEPTETRRKFARQLLMAMFSIAAPLASTPASADIITSNWIYQGFGPGSTLNLDVNHDGSTDLSFSSFSSYAGTDYWGNNYYSHQVNASALQLWQPVQVNAISSGTPLGTTPSLGSSLVLDSNSPILSYGVRETQWRCNGQWWGCSWYLQYYYGYANDGTTYDNSNLGRMLQPFAFDNGGNTNYGFADIDIWMNNDGQYAGNVRRYVFDDSGARAVAAIPEPETYAMMLAGLGMLGVVARRRARSRAHPRLA